MPDNERTTEMMNRLDAAVQITASECGEMCPCGVCSNVSFIYTFTKNGEPAGTATLLIPQN